MHHQVPACVINNICHFRKSFNAQYFNVREVKRQRNGNVKVYSLMLDNLTFGKLSTIHLEGAMTDIRFFPRSTFSKSLVHKKKFWHDMTSFQVRIHILPGEVGDLF